MSWPVRPVDVAAAFASPPEADVWLNLRRKDLVKQWSRREHGDALETQLLECDYQVRWVRTMVDLHRDRHSTRLQPAWYGMDDPPLVSALVWSLPTPVMGAAGLSKDRTARVFGELVASALARVRPITQRDWRLEVWLDTGARELITRVHRRDTREWERVEERRQTVAAE